jgi:ribosomal protein S12 methylthiotransferase accessory factor
MTAMVNAQDSPGDILGGAALLFEVVELPSMGMPASFAIALPGASLLQMPGIPEAAMPEAGRMASGRGLGAASARQSCLGEAAELFSCCAWGDEILVAATLDEIGPAGILPEALNGFDPGQLEKRASWNRRLGGFDWRPAAGGFRGKLDWLAARDAFGGKPVFVPADFAFIGRRRAGDRRAVAVGDSNGCAAGVDADAARLAALLELVERDATGRWWYGRRHRPAIDPASFASLGALAPWLSGRRRVTRLVDITTDIGIPVIAACSAEADGSDVALGFAARLDREAGAISAVTEMLQMEVSLETARLLGDTAGAWAAWRDEVSMATRPLSAGFPSPLRGGARGGSAGVGFESKPASPNLAVALELLAAQSIDLCFIDMTRAEIGVPVFRAVSAMLCHYKPRFGKARLLAPDARDIEPVAFDEQPLLLI